MVSMTVYRHSIAVRLSAARGRITPRLSTHCPKTHPGIWRMGTVRRTVAEPLLPRATPDQPSGNPILAGAPPPEQQALAPGGAESTPPSPDAAAWKPKLYKWIGTLLPGLVICLLPMPAGVQTDAWRLLAIFVSTIVGIIVEPLPLGSIAFMAAGVCMLTGTLTFKETFAAFSADVPWLIATAMFLAIGFRKTGLGRRLACACVSVLGANPLGLTYSLVFTEALLAPAIPSVAARAGGILLPIIQSLCSACGSSPNDGTQRRLGSYLLFTVFSTAAVSSAMFLTANHPNPLSAKLAESAVGQSLSWGLWAKAACVPGLISLVCVPLLVHLLYPPQLKDSERARRWAVAELESMGAMSGKELVMMGTMLLTVVLWVFGPTLGVGVVASAMGGLSILLVTEVVTWQDCLSEKNAWNTLTWFAVLIAMATQLKAKGLIDVLTNSIASLVASFGLAWQPSFLILVLVYFYSHYLFASNVAHVTAMYSAFLSVAVGAGTHPLLAALVLAYFSNMMGAISTWGMSHGPMYFQPGFVPQRTWMTLALAVSVFNIVVWVVVGGAWWRFLGLW